MRRDPSSSAVGARPRLPPTCAVVTVASSDGLGSLAASESADPVSDGGAFITGRRFAPGSCITHPLGRLPSRVMNWKSFATKHLRQIPRPTTRGVALRAIADPMP